MAYAVPCSPRRLFEPFAGFLGTFEILSFAVLLERS